MLRVDHRILIHQVQLCDLLSLNYSDALINFTLNKVRNQFFFLLITILLWQNSRIQDFPDVHVNLEFAVLKLISPSF